MKTNVDFLEKEPTRRGLISTAWGSLEPSMETPFSVDALVSCRDKPGHVLVRLIVKISPHFRVWRAKGFPVEGDNVVEEVYMPFPSPTLSETTLSVMVIQLMKEELCRRAAPRLYEIDPRIGMTAVVKDTLLTPHPLQSPLFKPKVGFYAPCLYSDKEAGFVGKALKMFSRCAGCGCSFYRGEGVVWGGAHLLWMCRECTSPLL